MRIFHIKFTQTIYFLCYYYFMKRKSILIKFIFFILLTIIILSYFNKENKIVEILKKSEFENNISYNEDYDFDDVQEKIIEFLNLYYKSIYYLEENDFTSLFNEESSELYLTQKAILYQIETRKLETNDLHLSNAEYNLDFDSINQVNNNYEVVVYEDSEFNFEFMKDITSKMYDIENVFTFDENYNLISFRREQDFYNLFTENLEENFNNESVDNIYNTYYMAKQENINQKSTFYEEYLNNLYTPNKVCDNNYDRETAIEYAKKYVIERNLDDFDMFDYYGGNCQNYASQVIFTGGIPMDIYGEDVWKYYGSTPSSSNTKYGRSSSWTIVNDFYLYAKSNEGYGLCSEVDVNYYYADKGDIMQVGYDDFFHHTIVVKDVIKNEEENVIDILTMSNTNNYENIPISSLASPQIRLIKINGWNN